MLNVGLVVLEYIYIASYIKSEFGYYKCDAGISSIPTYRVYIDAMINTILHIKYVCSNIVPRVLENSQCFSCAI